MNLKWGTICGHWGDVLLSVQKFKEDIGEGNIIYMGPFDEVVDFLKQQPFIHKVKHVKTKDFFGVIKHLFRSDAIEDANWKEKFNPDNSIPNDLILPTFLTKDVKIWHDPVLSPEALKWAEDTANHLPPVFFLCQPYSFASVSKRKHWQNWQASIRELVENSPFTFVMAGKDWPEDIYFKPHPRLINLANTIPDIQHMYALSNRATGVLTTSNSLAHWCAASGTPTVVVCNASCSNPEYFFRQALEAGGEHMHFVNSDASVAEAIDAMRSVFPFP